MPAGTQKLFLFSAMLTIVPFCNSLHQTRPCSHQHGSTTKASGWSSLSVAAIPARRSTTTTSTRSASTFNTRSDAALRPAQKACRVLRGTVPMVLVHVHAALYPPLRRHQLYIYLHLHLHHTSWMMKTQDFIELKEPTQTLADMRHK